MVMDLCITQEYSQTKIKARSVLESLELSMKQLLESHDRKQKVQKVHTQCCMHCELCTHNVTRCTFSST